MPPARFDVGATRQQKSDHLLLSILRRSEQQTTSFGILRLDQTWSCLQRVTECGEIVSIQRYKGLRHVPTREENFDHLRVEVRELHRMVQRLRDVGRSDACSVSEHDLHNLGLRQKSGILKRRPSVTAGNDEVRVFDEQPMHGVGIVGFDRTFDG